MRFKTRVVLGEDLIEGCFSDRPNRYLSNIIIHNEQIEAFVPNPGRMTELMIPGYPVLLRKVDSESRKTQFDLVAVKYMDEWVCIDSLIPNKFLFQALSEEIFEELTKYHTIRKEVKYSSSRFDFFLSGKKKGCFIEAKSCTLVEDGIALFPDAPTKRGVKHVNELIQAVEEGYEGYVIIVIQRGDAKLFKPNGNTDPEFSDAIRSAVNKGVKVIAISTILCDKYIQYNGRVEVKI